MGSDSVTRKAFPMRKAKLRSVSFPIQITRVTRVTRDVFLWCMPHTWQWSDPVSGSDWLFSLVNQYEKKNQSDKSKKTAAHTKGSCHFISSSFLSIPIREHFHSHLELSEDQLISIVHIQNARGVQLCLPFVHPQS